MKRIDDLSNALSKIEEADNQKILELNARLNVTLYYYNGDVSENFYLNLNQINTLLKYSEFKLTDYQMVSISESGESKEYYRISLEDCKVTEDEDISGFDLDIPLDGAPNEILEDWGCMHLYAIDWDCYCGVIFHFFCDEEKDWPVPLIDDIGKIQAPKNLQPNNHKLAMMPKPTI